MNGMATGKKILIVEDDHFLTKLYSVKFSQGGFTVLLASNGEEGVRKAVLEKPDLVLLDMILPKKNGFDVLRDLTANPATKDIPVIILSNLGQEQDIEEAKRLGAIDYIVKTATPIAEVVERVKGYLQQQQP